MVENSKTSDENEIHRVDSPFNEDPKNIFFLPGKLLFPGKDRWKI